MKVKFVYTTQKPGQSDTEKIANISEGGGTLTLRHYEPGPDSVELAAGTIVKVTDLLKTPEKYRKSYRGTETQWRYLLFLCCMGEKETHKEKTPKHINDLFHHLLRGLLPEKKSGKHRGPGHLFDEMLKPGKPIIQGKLFGEMDEDTKNLIEGKGVEIKHVVQGVQLSAAERKLVGCFIKLLHHRSETNSDQVENNYLGNSDDWEEMDRKVIVQVKKTIQTIPAPELVFTMYELAKEYKGGETPSGKDIENVTEVLRGLDRRDFLFSYTETIKLKKGGKIERKVEDYKKLIHIKKLSETKYGEDDIEVSKREETTVQLNPIFREQIDTKFIEIPDDMIKRLEIAAGTSKITEVSLKLVDYLTRYTSTQGEKHEIGLEKLYNILAAKWMEQSRKKLVKQQTSKAVEICKRLGLLKEWNEVPAKNGEIKVVFVINKEWI
jgi:hypothetical protein